MSANHGQIVGLELLDLFAFVRAGLTPPFDGETVEFVEGPADYYDTINASVSFVQGRGSGFILEDTYDREVWALDIAGPQGDPDGARLLARQIDRRLVSVCTPTRIGSARVLYIARAGGRPGHVGIDEADRWHLAGSYAIPVESGI